MDTSKKVARLRIILLPVLLIFSLQAGLANDNNNDYKKNDVITNLYSNYQRNKSKFIGLAIERLHQSITKDKYLREAFYSNDSALLKKLQVFINPLIKLKPEAINYTYSDDISQYLELDTINFDCVAGFFLDDTLCFNVARGHNECDIKAEFMDSITPDWCPEKYYFYQHYYYEKESRNCVKSEFRVIKDTNFVFRIDGLMWNFFTIKDGKLLIYPLDQEDINTGLLDKPNDFIRSTYKEKFIRRSARNCPLSKTWKK
ncbi:MAG: hypothetical protein ACM3U1_02355 [Chloroflexota bacterium]